MVQASDGNKGMPAFTIHQPFDGIQHTANNKTGCFIDTRESRRVSAIEKTLTTCRLFNDPANIFMGVKTLNYRPICEYRLTLRNTPIKPGRLYVCPECAQAIRPERVSLAKPVAGQVLSDIDTGRFLRRRIMRPGV